MENGWIAAAVVFVVYFCGAMFIEWVGRSLLEGRGLPYRILLKRAEEDPYFNREYARPKKKESANG